MAPRNSQPNDPNRIDVSLDLVGPGSLQAIEQLTSQLAAVESHLRQFSSTSPEVQQRAATQASGRMHEGIWHGPHAYQSTPGSTPPVIDAAGVGASYAAEDQLAREGNMSAWRRYRTWREQGRGPANMLDRQIEVYGARERAQVRRRGGLGIGGGDFEEPSTTHAGYIGGAEMEMGGGVSSGASLPPNSPSLPSASNEPTWLRALKANPVQFERAQEGFRVPQFGEFNIQDKLRMGSDFFTRSALRNLEQARAQQRERVAGDVQQTFGFGDEEMGGSTAQGVIDRRLSQMDFSNVAVNRGRTANVLRMAADQSAQIVAASSEARRLFNWGTATNATGVQAGGQTGATSILGVPMPFRLPNLQGLFSDDPYAQTGATAEGVRQRINVQRLRLRGGIDGEQANMIVGSLAQLGWTGAQGQRAAFDAVAPLVQQGLNPQITSGLLDQSIRQGASSLEDFRNTMEDLGPLAHAARMNLDEFQEALGQFAETAQQGGATFGQGLRLGTDLSRITGLAPQQAAGLMENPLVQGLLTQQYGVLPQEQGALAAANPGTLIGATGRAITLARQQAAGFARTPVRDPQTGEIVMSGARRSDAMAARFFDPSGRTSVDVFRRIEANQQVAPHLARANQALNRIQSAGQRAHELEARDGGGKIINAAAPGHSGGQIIQRRGEGQHHDEIEHGVDIAMGQEWGAIHRELMAAAPKTGAPNRKEYIEALRDVEDIEDPRKRAASAKKLLANRASDFKTDDRPEVRVAFTGAAAKYFQQVEKKLPDEFKAADKGGTPRNRYLADPAPGVNPATLLGGG